MALKITKEGNFIIFTNTETGDIYPYQVDQIEARYTDTSVWFEHNSKNPNAYPFRVPTDTDRSFEFSEIQDANGNAFSTKQEISNYLSEINAINNLDWAYDVSLGNIPNATLWNKFGYNLDVDTGGEEIIASWGEAFDPTSDIMSTAQTFTITYNNSTDGLGQTGATTLLIYYLSEDLLPAIAFHTLSNTGSDVTSFTGLGINRAIVYANGGLGWNANDITFTATTDGTTQGQIPATQSVTQQAIYHTSIGYKMPLEWLKGNIRKVTSAGSRVRYTVKGYSWSRVTQTRYEIFRYDGDSDITDGFQLTPPLPFVIQGREVVYFTIETDTNNTVANIRFSGIESKDR